LSYKDVNPSVAVNVDDDFNSGTDGWSTPNNGGSINNTNQKLNISITNKWNKSGKYVTITPNVPLHIEFDFEEGDMDITTFFVKERINGVWESNSNRDYLSNMQDGHHVMDLTLTGDYIWIYFEKGSSTDNGTSTTCYVDDFKLTQNALEILEENNFYPFGLEHKGYNNVVSPNTNSVAKKFKYQGQELNESLGYNMYEFELRHYDATIGRFVTTDPYEQFMSPYVAMGNNPVVSFDPDGGLCYDANGNSIACPDDDIYDEYRDNPDNRIDIMDEVVVTADLSDIADKKANEAYWAGINASAEILNNLATLNTGKTSEGRAREAQQQISLITTMPISVEIQPTLIGGGAIDLIGGKAGYNLISRLLRVKSVSLPALKSLTVDMTHILSGHVKGGSRVSTMKTLFDSNLSPKQIENMVKAAYKNAKKLKTQGNRVKVVGQSDNGTVIEMWVNKATKVIESAYPIK